jgi:glucan biosynthesis protein C
MTQPTERFHALDALRAGALLLGIALHGTMSFVVGIPALDNSPSSTLAVLFFVIHIFRMSLFYVLAGYFACLLLQSKGWREFLRNRLKRVALPLLLFWFVLVPLTAAPTLWGIMRSYSPELQEQITASGSGGVPLLHLWFLYYLLIFYVLTIGGWLLLERSGISHTGLYRRLRHLLQQLLLSPAAALLLALPLAGGFLLLDNWNAWAGIPTHDAGLVPWPSQILFYGLPFLVGWLLYGRSDILQRWQQQWRWYLLLAAALSAWCLREVGLNLSIEQNLLAIPDYFEGSATARILYALLYSLALWCWCFGLIGAALRFGSSHNPHVRYMADASYWLYLMHIPVIFTLQALMMNWPLHWSLKFTLIMALTMGLLLWIYDRWVQPGRIGELLNGRRYPRREGNEQGKA